MLQPLPSSSQDTSQDSLVNRAPGGSGLLSHEERVWAMGCHAIGVIGYIVPGANIYGPLVMWLSKREISTWVDANGKESLNYHITLTFALGIAIYLGLVDPVLTILGVGLFVADHYWRIKACIRAAYGEPFTYPVKIQFVK